MKYSRKEIIDITKAWGAISVAFAIFLGGLTSNFFSAFLLSAFTVGIGFLFHELAHKLIAQKYGCFAEFRSFDSMLLLAIAMSFLGFIFAAPGAVMISGYVDFKKNGKISLAGPLTNLILAFLFLILIFIFGNFSLASYGFRINTWLALFNMIPFGNFDGVKILKWDKLVYALIVIVSFVFLFFPVDKFI